MADRANATPVSTTALAADWKRQVHKNSSPETNRDRRTSTARKEVRFQTCSIAATGAARRRRGRWQMTRQLRRGLDRFRPLHSGQSSPTGRRGGGAGGTGAAALSSVGENLGKLGCHRTIAVAFEAAVRPARNRPMPMQKAWAWQRTNLGHKQSTLLGFE